MLIETLEIHYLFYGSELEVERLGSIFLKDAKGRRPCHGDDQRYATDPYWKDLVLFYEYFHGDTGRGLGANHQTGWTAVVVRCFHRAAERYQRFQFEPHEPLPKS